MRFARASISSEDVSRHAASPLRSQKARGRGGARFSSRKATRVPRSRPPADDVAEKTPDVIAFDSPQAERSSWPIRQTSLVTGFKS